MPKVKLVALVALVSCSPLEREDPHPRIVDQSGAEFYWVCSRHDCEPHRISGVSPPAPECEHGPGFFREDWRARFLEVVEGCPLPGDGWWFADADGNGRIVVCDEDTECPEVEGVSISFECRAGFCQSDDTEEHPPALLSQPEVVKVCTGHVPRGEDDSPSPELAAAIEVACPSEHDDNPYIRDCVGVPPECPDPR